MKLEDDRPRCPDREENKNVLTFIFVLSLSMNTDNVDNNGAEAALTQELPEF